MSCRRWPRLLLALCALSVAFVAAPAAHANGTLTVSLTGQGGSVTGPGINCNGTEGSDCTETVPSEEVCFENQHGALICQDQPQTVELTAAAGTGGYTFNGWTGCDEATGSSCLVTVSGPTAVTAMYGDNTNPVASGVGPFGVQKGTINLTANASDNVAVKRVDFYVRGAKVGEDTSSPYSVSFNTTSVANGSAVISATAVDTSDRTHTAQSTITIDNTPPAASINSGPNGDTFGPGTTQTWTFSASDTTTGIQSLQCRVAAAGTAGTFGACSAVASHSVSNLPEGSYTFTLRARDAAGHETTVTRTFAIDATAPDTTIDSGPAGGSSSTDPNATFAFSATEAGSTFVCRVYPAGITPPDFTACSGAGSHTATGLNPGNYTFEVQATDAYGNADGSPATRNFTIAAPASGGTGSDSGSGSGSGGTGSTPPPEGPAPGGEPSTTGGQLLASGPTVARTRLRRALSRGLAVGFRCSRGCAITAQLRAAGSLLAATKVVARGNKTLLTAGSGKVVLKFTRKAKRALARKRSVRLTLVFSVKAADGSVKKVTRRVTLRR